MSNPHAKRLASPTGRSRTKYPCRKRRTLPDRTQPNRKTSHPLRMRFDVVGCGSDQLRPHPEEARSAVSKDGNVLRTILRNTSGNLIVSGKQEICGARGES